MTTGEKKISLDELNSLEEPLSTTIAVSRAESNAVDQTLLRHSLMVLGAIVVAVLLVVGALIPW